MRLRSHAKKKVPLVRNESEPVSSAAKDDPVAHTAYPNTNRIVWRRAATAVKWWMVIVAVYIACNQFTTVPIGVERTNLHPPANYFDFVCNDLLYHIVWFPCTLVFGIVHISTLMVHATDHAIYWLGQQCMKIWTWTIACVIYARDALVQWFIQSMSRLHAFLTEQAFPAVVHAIRLGYKWIADAIEFVIDFSLFVRREWLESVWPWIEVSLLAPLFRAIASGATALFQCVEWTCCLFWDGVYMIVEFAWECFATTCRLLFVWLLVPLFTLSAICIEQSIALCVWMNANILVSVWNSLSVGMEISRQTAIWFLHDIVWFYLCLVTRLVVQTTWPHILSAWKTCCMVAATTWNHVGTHISSAWDACARVWWGSGPTRRNWWW